jgi:mannitol-1-phosphate/altronate dehydrogenase
MFQTTQKLAGQLQAQLGLEKAWTVGCEEYNQFKVEVSMRKYHCVLDELE